jgi:hypothetical protein
MLSWSFVIPCPTRDLFKIISCPEFLNLFWALPLAFGRQRLALGEAGLSAAIFFRTSKRIFAVIPNAFLMQIAYNDENSSVSEDHFSSTFWVMNYNSPSKTK